MNVQSATAIANYYQQNTASSAVSVAQALSAVKVNPRAKFTLQDSAANIESNFTSLAAIANNVSSVTLTDQTNSFITITAKQLLTPSATALTNKMSLGGNNKVSLNVIDALAKDIATLQPASSNKIGQFSIKDTSTNISAKFDSIAAFETKLGNIQQTDPAKFVKITNAQYSANSSVRTHFIGTFGFEVSGVNTSQALAMKNDNNVAKVNIVDHAQNISDKLDELQDMGLKVNTIKSDDPALFKVSADQLNRDGAVIGKIYKGYQLAVFNIDAGTALSIKSNKKIVSLDIVDTAEGISKNLALLGKLGNQVHSLQITDGKPLAVTSKAYFQSDAILKKVVDVLNSDEVKIDGPVNPVSDPSNTANFNNIYQLDILESSAVDAVALKNNPRINSISIKDTSAAISANISAINSIKDSNGDSLIKGIDVVGNNNIINVTIDQLTNDTAAVSLLKSNNGSLKFNVRGVAAGDAKALLDNTSKRVASVSVSDTAKNIVDNLSDLASLGKNLSTIIQTDARVPGAQGVALSLSANDWMLNIGSLSKIVGGYGVNLKDVGAAKALSLANDARVKSFEVLDSAEEISSNFDTLKTLGTKLTSIKQSDTKAIEITGRQYSSQGNILSKLESSYKLDVKNAQANQVGGFVQDKAHLSSVQVIDTVDNIAGNLGAIQEAATPAQLGSNIKVSMTGTPKPFTLSVADLETYQDALKVIQDNYKVNLTNVEATDAKSFVEDENKPIHSHLLSMTVNASSLDLSNKDLLADLNSLGNKISQVSQKDVGELISITQADWETNSNFFAKINGYQVSLGDVSASGAKNLLLNEHVANVKVLDTGSQISLNFGTLMGLGPSVTSIKQGDSSNLQLSMELWKSGSDTLSKIEDGYTVDLTGSSASDAGTVVNNASVISIAIKDSALEISTNFNNLLINDKISNIVLNGEVAPFKITQTQLTDGTALLGKVQGSYTLAVSDATVSAVADLISNTHVVSAEMSGTSSEVSDSLSVLSQFGPKLKSLSLNDENPAMSLSFTNFQQYKNVLGLIPQNFKIDLNEVKAGDAVNQGLNSQFNLSFNVQDSAAQIASNIDGLASLKSKLVSVTSSEGTPVLTLKSSQYLANKDVLAKVNASNTDSPYKLVLSGGNIKFAQDVLGDVDQAGKINSLDISDSAENISNNFDTISDSKILTVRLTSGSSTLSLNGDDYSNSSALTKVKGTFDINVNNAAVSQTTAMQADSRVSSYSLDATSSDVGTSLPDLLDLSKLDHINITQDDTAMSVSLDDYVLIEDKLNKLVGNYGLNVSEVKVSDIETLFDKNEVSSIQVSDTSANISQNWDQLVNLGNKLQSIENTTDQTPVAITFDQYGTSASTIAKFSTTQSLALLEVSPDQATSAAVLANVATVSVIGLADQVASNFESLVALGTKLDSIEINDSNPIELTQTQYDADVDEVTLNKINGHHELVILE